MPLMCSCRGDPGSAWISCTFFSPPLVTNRRRALLSWGSTLGRKEQTLHNTGIQNLKQKLHTTWSLSLAYLAKLAQDMFEDVTWGIIEKGLQSWQVGALLQDAFQSLLTLQRPIKTKNLLTQSQSVSFLSYFSSPDLHLKNLSIYSI